MDIHATLSSLLLRYVFVTLGVEAGAATATTFGGRFSDPCTAAGVSGSTLPTIDSEASSSLSP
jgi:hypothetical protein